ncbi:MAG: hypothetical protein RSB34_01420, partial [Muribaculaceae bacterium]
FTIKHGRFTRTVTVSYRPHPGFLMAKGDLTYKKSMFYLLPNEEATTIESQTYYGSCFKFGNLESFKNIDDGGIPEAPYSQYDAMFNLNSRYKYTDFEPEAGPFVVHNIDKIWFGLGDPCRLVGLNWYDVLHGSPDDNEIWRLPTADELKLLTIPEAKWSGVMTNAKGRKYRKSELFSLYFPLAGGRREDGKLGADIVDLWGCWQSNTRTVTSPNSPYTGLSTTTSLMPFFDEYLPIVKAHTIRCIRQ